MEFSDRQLAILNAIISDYIETAIPVGSRTIARKYMPDISSATIRNEMSDLEHMGLLVQPHTSAGRIPSHTAYRMYVNKIIREHKSDDIKDIHIADDFERLKGEMLQVVRNAAALISINTNYTAIALTPQLRRTTLKRMQLIPVTKGLALVVIVTDAARVKQKMIQIPANVSESLLDELSFVISKRFSGQAIADIDLNLVDGISDIKLKHPVFFEAINNYLSDVVVKSDSSDVVLEGVKCIFDYPEYRDVSHAKRFINLLDSKELLQKILSDSTRRGTSVIIGGENSYEELRDFSVVTTSYKVASRPIGAIGVIGPVRMDYSRVIAVLEQTGKALSNVMTSYINE
jgi:heat-inducible transcriptional repressor